MGKWTSSCSITLHEAQTIQCDLKTLNKKKTIAEISKKFAEQMQKGNINAAIKLLTNNMQNGILPLNDETLSQLKQKHPEAKTAYDAALLTDIPEDIHSSKFENLDADMILKAAIKTKGGAGPSGMDVDGWRPILVSNNFGKSNFDLRKACAEVVKKLYIKKDQSSTLLACRLIPLDQNPGLRPIGVCEVLRRIAGKAVAALVRNDTISSVGSLQECAGHEAGCESAIHAMHSIFQEQSTEAVLLVDASNAFNSVNRSVFLHSIAIMCPAIACMSAIVIRCPLDYLLLVDMN